MQNQARPRILCVDDEPHLLDGLALTLGRRYEVAIAVGGQAGLDEIARLGPPCVVLTDVRMPGMNGAAFLARVREIAPDTVRLLFTGQADIDACIAGVNEGQIFRFLTKPCAPEQLLETVRAAVEQYNLLTSRRTLLEQTLRGSIKSLIDILSLANPLTFGRASRIKQAAGELTAAAQEKFSWQIEVAAMLSQIGCISLPFATMEKIYYGRALSADEIRMAAQVPEVTDQVLSNIPGLEEVREILRFQDSYFDLSRGPQNGASGSDLPFGARVLKIVTDFVRLESEGLSAELALETLRNRTGRYDPALLDTFCRMRGWTSTESVEIPLQRVQTGMIFAEDVRSPGGALLIARGYEVTASLVQRLQNFAPDVKRQNVRILIGALTQDNSNLQLVK